MSLLRRLMGRSRALPRDDGRVAGEVAGPSGTNPGARACCELGLRLLAQGQAQAAIGELTKAIALRMPEDDFQAEAQLALARAYAALGEGERAIACVEAALAVRPGYREALMEGIALLHKLGRHKEAVAWQDQTLPADAEGTAADWLRRGNEALQTWNLQRAAACYRNAAAADPGDPHACLNRGFVAVEQGDALSALGYLGRALDLQGEPHDLQADAHFLLGRAYRQLEQPGEALSAFSAAIAIRPRFAEVMEEAIGLLFEHDRYEEAIGWAQNLQAARPSITATLELAKALAASKRHEEALQQLDAVLETDASQAEAWTGRGHVLLALQRPEDAMDAYQHALALVGPTTAALANEAKCLAKLGQREAAVARYRALLAREPGNGALAADLMSILFEMRQLQEAIDVGEKALSHNPDDAEVHWALSYAYLVTGDFGRGWREYEWRWTAKGGTKPVLPDFGRKRWLGDENLAGKTILLAPEQGLGDSIQFLRYVPQVADRASTVFLSLTAELCELAANSGLPANCVVVPPGGKVDSFDLQTSLMSLPLALGPDQAIPAVVPYLRADHGRLQTWKDRLATHDRRFNIGIAWSGNPDHAKDHKRSIPLSTFRSLEAKGCRFISLQPFVRPSDQAALQAWSELLNWGPELRSFTDTAALMLALDMVVSVDTSVAHLAGALGCPTRILLPFVPDWRWMLDREDTPWYPTVRLCRQPQAGQWEPVLAAVRAELEHLAAAARET